MDVDLQIRPVQRAGVTKRAYERPVPASEEHRLVEAARAGNRLAFERLHKAYAPIVHAVLLSKVAYQDAEDLVQDVFARAYEGLARLRDAGAFGGWLMRIARNRAADHYRRRRVQETLPDEVATDAVPAAEAREALDAIRALPEAYRETLLMRLVEGLTGPEIAARTGLKAGSVRVNLHRGMRMLRRTLGMDSQ